VLIYARLRAFTLDGIFEAVNPRKTSSESLYPKPFKFESYTRQPVTRHVRSTRWVPDIIVSVRYWMGLGDFMIRQMRGKPASQNDSFNSCLFNRTQTPDQKAQAHSSQPIITQARSM